MKIISKTIAGAWRDILAFILIGLGFAILGGLTDYLAIRWGDDSRIANLLLPTISNYLQGFSRFTGAAICATIVWMAVWPTVASWGNNSFQAGWNALTNQQRFAAYVALIATALIAAAICFAQ